MLTFVTAYVVIRIGSSATRRLERDLSRVSGDDQDALERARRAQTLAQLLRKMLTASVSAVVVLMTLRELGVDITPALTGAGIVGLVVGLAGQTVVRDFLSGFFVILEDQVRVGDSAVINGQDGVVEQVNLRTLVLRDGEGTLHVFPNSEVRTLANRSRDFAFFALTVAIPSSENPDRAMQAMRDAGDMLMRDPEFKDKILDPLVVDGIVSWKPGEITLGARIKTLPAKQSIVGRELRRRIANSSGIARLLCRCRKWDLTIDQFSRP